MKNKEIELIDTTLSQIELNVNKLRHLNIGGLDNVDISKACSRLLTFSEQLNNLAYTNLYTLEMTSEVEPAYLSLLKNSSAKEGI